MTKPKKQFVRQSVKIDDVFKVKNKSSKKQNKSKVIKSKSRQALQQGCDMLDDQFVQLQQQSCDTAQHNKVQPISGVQCSKQAVNVEDATDRLAKL